MKNNDHNKLKSLLERDFTEPVIALSAADVGPSSESRQASFLRVLTPVATQPLPARKSWREQARLVGAVVGLLGGLAASLGGSLLIVASWIVRQGAVQSWLSTSGTVLLYLTIPLLLLGACCLDWLEMKRQPRRLRIVPVETRPISRDQRERG